MVVGKIAFLASYKEPNDKEIDYWIDLKANPYGSIIKYYNGKTWQSIAATSSFDPTQYYDKSQVRELVNDAINNTEQKITASLTVLEDKIKTLEENWENLDGILDTKLFDLLNKNFSPITKEEIETELNLTNESIS